MSPVCRIFGRDAALSHGQAAWYHGAPGGLGELRPTAATMCATGVNESSGSPGTLVNRSRATPGALNLRHMTHKLLAAAAAAVLLASCGGGGGADHDGLPPPPEPAAGQLLGSSDLAAIDAAEIVQAIGADAGDIVAAVRYDVQTYRIVYYTEGEEGDLIELSGLLAVPDKAAGVASPLMSYQHPTEFHDRDAPSNDSVPEAPPVVLASAGFVVAAADAVGFGQSQGMEHPYLQARPSARATIDMLHAAQAWLQVNAVALDPQLYMVGYSEGGHTTLAAQRALTLEGGELADRLVATVPGAGPYDLQVTLDGLLAYIRDSGKLANVVGALIKPGRLSQLPREIRREVRRAIVRELIPDDADIVYDTQFIDDYLDDDQDLLLANNSVHWGWTPTAPVYLFHGRDDTTVPFAASESALERLRATGGADVQLRECTARPASHLNCVGQYIQYVLEVTTSLAGDRL